MKYAKEGMKWAGYGLSQLPLIASGGHKLYAFSLEQFRKAVHAECKHIDEINVFGGYVRDGRPFVSDLDLLVIYNEDFTGDQLKRLRSVYKKIKRHFPWMGEVILTTPHEWAFQKKHTTLGLYSSLGPPQGEEGDIQKRWFFIALQTHYQRERVRSEQLFKGFAHVVERRMEQKIHWLVEKSLGRPLPAQRWNERELALVFGQTISPEKEETLLQFFHQFHVDWTHPLPTQRKLNPQAYLSMEKSILLGGVLWMEQKMWERRFEEFKNACFQTLPTDAKNPTSLQEKHRFVLQVAVEPR